MTESIILSNTATAILSVIAFFATLVSYLISNKKIAATVQIIGFLCVLAVVTYALLLGAELLEILILILVFVFVSAFSFIPKSENAQSNAVDENKTDGKEQADAAEDKEIRSTNEQEVDDEL